MTTDLVEVYVNRPKRCLSVRNAKTRKLIGHATSIVLEDAIFKVSQKGRERVRRTRQRSVHAVVRGTWVLDPAWGVDPKLTARAVARDVCRTYVTYNPFGQVAGFHIVGTKTIVQRAAVVYLDQRSCLVADPR